MNNQSVRMNLRKDGREKTKVKVNGSLRGQGSLHVYEKENMAQKNKFNAGRQGHESQQQHRGVGTGRLECWTCGKEHLKRDCPQNQGVRHQIYSAQEVQTIGDVGQSIPCIYETVDNRQA